MSRIGICAACQIGDHRNHQRVVQAAPEGMYGGTVCDCKGECRNQAPKRNRRLLDRVLRRA